jgi:hypothetical protein
MKIDILRVCSLVTFVSSASAQTEAGPKLTGQKFKITVVAENGFVNIWDRSSLTQPIAAEALSGYIVEMIESVAMPERADFDYEIYTPSGHGSQCAPQLAANASEGAYSKDYYAEYRCGESDVTDLPETPTSTDMYWGIWYVTPGRQLKNQFTLPFKPPSTGALGMWGKCDVFFRHCNVLLAVKNAHSRAASGLLYRRNGHGDQGL